MILVAPSGHGTKVTRLSGRLRVSGSAEFAGHRRYVRLASERDGDPDWVDWRRKRRTDVLWLCMSAGHRMHLRVVTQGRNWRPRPKPDAGARAPGTASTCRPRAEPAERCAGLWRAEATPQPCHR